MNPVESDPDHLPVSHMLRAIAEIERDTAAGPSLFFGDKRTQKVVLFDVIHLAESASRTTPTFRKENRSIRWVRIASVGAQVLTSAGRESNLKRVWEFTQVEVPRIGRSLRRTRSRGPNHLRQVPDD